MLGSVKSYFAADNEWLGDASELSDYSSGPWVTQGNFDEDEEPDRNGKDDSGQESGLAGGGDNGDGPSLD